MQKLRIIALTGSLRKASYNTGILRAAAELAPPEFEIAQLALHGIPMFDPDLFAAEGFPPSVVALRATVAAADAVIIATPEYNHSLTGALKNAIDWMSRDPGSFDAKPVAIVSAAGSPHGGIRGQYHLRLILQPLDAHVLPMPEVAIGRAKANFNDAGDLTDAPSRELLGTQLLAFRDYIAMVRSLRAVAP